MEDLTKQQLILLALLVSFVTALATGIVTVSLMDQAPDGVTQTISKVIERTIEGTKTQSASVAGVDNTEDIAAKAVKAMLQSVVLVKNKITNVVIGKGLIVSKQGVIVTDKSVTSQAKEYKVVLHDGRELDTFIVQSQINGDIVFLMPIGTDKNLGNTIKAITFAPLPDLGQTVYSLSGTDAPILGQGVIEQVAKDPADPNSRIIHTSIFQSKIEPGSPLFNAKGEVIGINLSSLRNEDGSRFYYIDTFKNVIPVLNIQ